MSTFFIFSSEEKEVIFFGQNKHNQTSEFFKAERKKAMCHIKWTNSRQQATPKIRSRNYIFAPR